MNSKQTVIKNEVTPGTPLQDALQNIINSLRQGARIEDIRVQLHDILPAGNWANVNTPEQIMMEFDRLMKQEQAERSKPTLGKAINASLSQIRNRKTK